MSETVLTPLQEIGKRLKEGRIKRGWSVENVVQRTRISHRHIVSIEAGDLSSMPADVYARGFIRSYAKAVEIDDGPLMRLLDEAGIHSATERRGDRDSSKKPAIGHSTRIWLAAAGVIVGGAVIGLGIRGIFKLVGGSGEPEIPPSPFAAMAPAEKGTKTRAPEARRVKIMESKAKPDQEALRAVKVSVTATEDCWIQVQSDDSLPQDLTLVSGETRTWGAESRLRLLVGNAGGVRAHSSWGAVNLPKKKGRVVHLLFTPKGLERLEVPVLASATVSISGTPVLEGQTPDASGSNESVGSAEIGMPAGSGLEATEVSSTLPAVSASSTAAL